MRMLEVLAIAIAFYHDWLHLAWRLAWDVPRPKRSSIVFAVVHKAVFRSDNVVSSVSRLGTHLRRREFISLLGSAATAIVLQNSFWTSDQKFCGPLARLSCKDVRGLIASS